MSGESEMVTAILRKLEATQALDADIDFAITEYADSGAVRYSSAHQHFTSDLGAAVDLAERLVPNERLHLTRSPAGDVWFAGFAGFVWVVEHRSPAMAVCRAVFTELHDRAAFPELLDAALSTSPHPNTGTEP